MFPFNAIHYARLRRRWWVVDAYMKQPGIHRAWRRSVRKCVPFGPGFHGDKFLSSLADCLLSQSELFVETGSHVGHTTYHVGHFYPHLQVFSCDIDRTAVRIARAHSRTLSNVHVTEDASPRFLYELFERCPSLREKRSVYWLDAHWKEEWPLHSELEFLTDSINDGFIMIDDFKIPDHPRFGFDSYRGLENSFEEIEQSLAKGREYTCITPCYTQEDAYPVLEVEAGVYSRPTRYVSGVFTIALGIPAVTLPADLTERFKIASYRS